MQTPLKDRRPTQASLAASHDLDQKPVHEILDLIHAEDGAAHAAVGRCLPSMAEAADVLLSLIHI